MRDPSAAEPQPAVAKCRDTARQARREDGTSRPPHAAEGPASGQGSFFLHMVQRSWPRSRSQMLRIRGKAAEAAERHDPTQMQPLLSGSAFTLSFATLAVLDLHCECVAVEHGHIERQVKLILQLADGVPDQEIFPATLETAHDDGLLISKPYFEEVHILKHTIYLHQRWKNERSLHRRKRHIGPSDAVFVAYELRSLS